MGVPSARHSIYTHQRRAQTARRRTSSQGINATYGSVREAISDGRPYRDSDPLVSQINWDWQTWVHFPIRGFQVSRWRGGRYSYGYGLASDGRERYIWVIRRSL